MLGDLLDPMLFKVPGIVEFRGLNIIQLPYVYTVDEAERSSRRVSPLLLHFTSLLDELKLHQFILPITTTKQRAINIPLKLENIYPRNNYGNLKY